MELPTSVSLLVWLFPEQDSVLICLLIVCLTMCLYSLLFSTANPPVQSAEAMNLPEPISINSVDSTQERSIDDHGYELVNDSDHDDSTSEDAQLAKNKARVTYSRVSLSVNAF